MSTQTPSGNFSFPAPRDWVAAADFPKERNWEAILSQPDRYLVKRKLHREVLFLPGEAGAPGLYVKVFHPARPARRLLGALPPSAAAREYYLSRYLAQQGIAVAPALGFARYGRRGRDGGSLFVSAEVQNVLTFAEALQCADRNRAPLLHAYGCLLGRLNKLGLYVQDYYMDNVLVRETPRPGSPSELVLLDHEATRPVLGYFRKWRERNLIAAVLSDANVPLNKEEMAAVFKGYLETLAGRAPSEEALSKLRRRLDVHQAGLVKRRSRRSRYKRAERCGGLTVYRRRDIDGTDLVAAWEAHHNGPASTETEQAQAESSAATELVFFTARTVLTPVLQSLRLSPAQRAFRQAQLRDAHNCLGMIVERKTGRSALVFMRSGETERRNGADCNSAYGRRDAAESEAPRGANCSAK